MGGENWGKGKGTALDEVDQLCKQLSPLYDCAIMDGAATNTCQTPWDEEWESSDELLAKAQAPRDSGVADEDGIIALCESLNAGNDCKIQVCRAEAIFVARLNLAKNGGWTATTGHYEANGFVH